MARSTLIPNIPFHQRETLKAQIADRQAVEDRFDRVMQSIADTMADDEWDSFWDEFVETAPDDHTATEIALAAYPQFSESHLYYGSRSFHR